MKKLMAFIVIIMLFAMAAQAFENPFNFSLYNQIKLKGVDVSHMGSIQNDDSDISYAPYYDYQVTKAVINDEMKCTATYTIVEIYTMGFFAQGIGEIGTGGDADRIEVRVGMTNAIQAVKDYLKIEINLEYRVQFNDSDNDKTTFEHTNLLLLPSLAIGGGIPDSGFTWKLSETVELGFNPEFWKDADPTYQSWDGPAYDETDGDIILEAGATLGENGVNHPDRQQVTIFDHVNFETKLELAFEFFHFFAPENVKGTLKASNNFKAKMPFSIYVEEPKNLVNEFEFGFEVALAGPTFYVGLWGETSDYVNTSAPVDGDLGSNRSWEGDWIGNEGSLEDGASWVGDWDDNDAARHPRPNLKIGPKITFSYTKEWFGFGLEYKGYEGGIRRWDEDGLNNELSWTNELSVYAKFSL